MVRNDDGTVSSEYSTSLTDERPNSPNYGKEVLIPTVVNGKFTTPDGKIRYQGQPGFKEMVQAAWQHYLRTGENLGVFDNPQDADVYAQALHSRSATRPAPATPRAC